MFAIWPLSHIFDVVPPQFDVGAVPFYLAYTGFDNKEHMKTLYKVGDFAKYRLNFMLIGDDKS